jgi:NADH dehydrogenase [ubiquinone] 1 alpha subcomplex assembly factor 7
MLNHNSIINFVKEYINKEGYISLANLIQISLHSKSGYYQNKDPFEKNNSDFFTSPQASQIFGEVIGVWFISLWQNMGKPQFINLIELGAGSGALIRDILRVMQKVAPTLKINLHFLEINPILIEQQKEVVETCNNIINCLWHNTIDDLLLNINKNQQSFFIGNEFFDALEVEQFIYKDNSWYKKIILNKNDVLIEDFNNTITQQEQQELKKFQQFAKNNNIIEYSFKTKEIFVQIAEFLKQFEGMFLIIDYGITKVLLEKSSIRGYKKHKLLKLDEILLDLGSVDITHNVNFAMLEQWADEIAINRINTTTQAQFLNALGFKERLKVLTKDILEKQKHTHLAKQQLNQHLQLIDTESEDSMGNKFKVLAVFNGISIT